MKLIISKFGKVRRVEETPQDLVRIEQDKKDHEAKLIEKEAKKVRKDDLMKKLKLDETDVKTLLDIITDKEI